MGFEGRAEGRCFFGDSPALHTIRNEVRIVFLKAVVKGWNRDVRSGVVLCIYKVCPCCCGEPDCFKVHDRPERWFWAVVEEVVEKVLGLVIQWKCPLCLRTFRQLPGWAEPYKRYVTKTGADLAEKYVQEDKATYRSVAGQAHGDEPGFEEGRELSPTTVWRFVGAFGQRAETLAKASSLIRQKDPSCPIFRELVDVPKRKHRSEARRGVLLQAKKLFRTALVYLQVLGVPLFHEFGTAGG